MVFTSFLFLFLFLPLFLIAYYLLPFRWTSRLILVFSYVFYGWWRPDFSVLLLAVSVGTYALTLWMTAQTHPRHKMQALSVGVGLNLAALAYFKYFNFGADNFNRLLVSLGFTPFDYAPIILPIGLSFYIFQAISYMVDVYRGDAPKTDNLFDFLAFISFFPQLVAGPVLRYEPLAAQFRHRTHTWHRFSNGCVVFMGGFCAKVLIADSVAPLAEAAFALSTPTFVDAWLGTTAYTIQLFFDFSGYSSMAIGLGLMVGFVFPQNFNDPYHATSITEFWRRWHMSLSEWLKCYLYIPLGGNRLGRRRTYLNLLLTMTLGGLWHGANWTFVIWGCWHGTWLALEKYWRETHTRPLLPRAVATWWTMVLVMIGWVFFRASDVAAAVKMLTAMFGLSDWAMSPALAWQVAPERVGMLVVGIGLVWALPWLRTNARSHTIQWGLIPLFVWAIATLSAQAFTPFLYFQF